MNRPPHQLSALVLRRRDRIAVLLAVVIVLAWGGSLALGLTMELNLASPWPWLLMLLQTHLYTGLFITAHDAIHECIHRNKRFNHAFGWLTSTLFMFNYYPQLRRKHWMHHGQAGKEADPDVHQGKFLIWFFRFVKEYIHPLQIVLAGAQFNVLLLFFDQLNITLFWMIPGILSMLQLFYFGTYIPHKTSPATQNKHHSSTLKRNHLYAFLSCYFFGYHYEHHDAPHCPWWLLYREKDTRLATREVVA